MNSAGIATGNLSILVFFLVLILAPLLYCVRKKVEKSKPEYEMDEIQSASYAVTVALMRIRDGKDKGIDPDGILVKLTREMQRLAQVEGISSSSSSSSSPLPSTHIDDSISFDDHNYNVDEENDHHVVPLHVPATTPSSSSSLEAFNV